MAGALRLNAVPASCPCAQARRPGAGARAPHAAWPRAGRVRRPARSQPCAHGRRPGCAAPASVASEREAWTAGGGANGGGAAADGGGGGGGSGAAAGAQPGTGRAGGADGEDVVLLDVRGMHCGGCSSRVGRLLEAQPHVAGASVSLATEVALVRVRLPPALGDGALSPRLTRPRPDLARPAPRRRAGARAGGEAFVARVAAALVAALEGGGFRAGVRPAQDAAGAALAAAGARAEERRRQLAAATRRLVGAGLLAGACLVGHLGHLWPGAPAWLRWLGAPPVHAALSAAALAGPGRSLLAGGWAAARRGAPDMDSLVGLGAGAAFAVSCVAAALPGLGWRTCFEEPAMLLGVVLLGRTLEQRAKLQASADMASLQARPGTMGGGGAQRARPGPAGADAPRRAAQALLPARARLAVRNAAGFREVPASALAPGDAVVVLPGDRVPADGTVTAGRSSVDEATFTGEPLPVAKAPGARRRRRRGSTSRTRARAR